MAKDGIIKVIERAINHDDNFKSGKEEDKMKTKRILRMVLGMVFVVVLGMGCESGGGNPAGPSGDTGTVADTGSGSGAGSGSDTTPPATPPPPSTPSVPVAYMTPGHIDFGDVLIGSEKNESAIIENKGTAVLEIIKVSNGGESPVPFKTTKACDLIPPGASCEHIVRFEPTKLGNHQTGYFEITTNDPVNPILKTTLSGNGKIIFILPKS